MSTTSVTVEDSGYTIVTNEDGATTTVSSLEGSVTEVIHGTINQPYVGPTIYVQVSAPTSPTTGSIWYDTSP